MIPAAGVAGNSWAEFLGRSCLPQRGRVARVPDLVQPSQATADPPSFPIEAADSQAASKVDDELRTRR